MDVGTPAPEYAFQDGAVEVTYTLSVLIIVHDEAPASAHSVSTLKQQSGLLAGLCRWILQSVGIQCIQDGLGYFMVVLTHFRRPQMVNIIQRVQKLECAVHEIHAIRVSLHAGVVDITDVGKQIRSPACLLDNHDRQAIACGRSDCRNRAGPAFDAYTDCGNGARALRPFLQHVFVADLLDIHSLPAQLLIVQHPENFAGVARVRSDAGLKRGPQGYFRPIPV